MSEIEDDVRRQLQWLGDRLANEIAKNARLEQEMVNQSKTIEQLTDALQCVPIQKNTVFFEERVTRQKSILVIIL